ncbi:hypothetical protein OMCYN_01809 [cyanobiont of Ornithocercus magnificus]|nr:hypothetical protein OMCYN_01809 [cyanobiont of Ornithocercus magnificus]
MAPLNNPLSSLCLGIIRNWVTVVRKGKGGRIDEQGRPWTRLPAWQINEQLAREFQLEVSTRRIYRALDKLVAANLICRKQNPSCKRDYWYTLITESHTAKADTPIHLVKHQQSKHRRPEARVKSCPGTSQSFSRPDRRPCVSVPSDTDEHMQLTQVSNPILNTQVSTSLFSISPVLASVETPKDVGESEEKTSYREEMEEEKTKQTVAEHLSDHQILVEIPSPRTRTELDKEVQRERNRAEEARREQRRKQTEEEADRRKGTPTSVIGAEQWIAEKVKRMVSRSSQLPNPSGRGMSTCHHLEPPLRHPEAPRIARQACPATYSHASHEQQPSKGFEADLPTLSKPRFVERPEKLLGVDKFGREIKEVWVSGFRHLVVD